MHLKCLAIETSCDETAVAIVDSNKNIISQKIYSQIKQHSAYKGVVPEIAARAHIDKLKFLINQVQKESGLTIDDMDLIAATGGPGLIGGVIIGTMMAKAISATGNIPYLAINHLEGHALTARLTEDLDYPFLLLLVSGGHCQLIEVKSLGDYIILGTTLDDAVGEAFDKIAKYLDLPYPGGPEIEKRAKLGNDQAFSFPLSMINSGDYNMSFSGLKTALRRKIDYFRTQGNLDEERINDICACFQRTIATILAEKSRQAMEYFNAKYGKKDLVVAGGVAANQTVKNLIKTRIESMGANLYTPPTSLCTDNAAMIGWSAIERYKSGQTNSLDFCPRAKWKLDNTKFDY
jgi:N6-L-threonylcarbamoyladenine synthase